MILRDLDQLMERFLKKMRKSFSRIYWDDEGEMSASDFMSDDAF